MNEKVKKCQKKLMRANFVGTKINSSHAASILASSQFGRMQIDGSRWMGISPFHPSSLKFFELNDR